MRRPPRTARFSASAPTITCTLPAGTFALYIASTMASSDCESIDRCQRFADDYRVTVGVRIMYGEAQAQKLGLLPARWDSVSKKTLAKVLALCDMLGCRPAQNRVMISDSVPGSVETVHLNRAYNNVSTIASIPFTSPYV